MKISNQNSLPSKTNTPACGTIFDWDRKGERIAELKAQADAPGLWNDPESAAEIMQELSALERERGEFVALRDELATVKEFLALPELAPDDETTLRTTLEHIAGTLARAERSLLFGGPYDEGAALLTVRSGAGGTEAQDWAEMLLRMYLRYAERAGYRALVLDETRGQEAGIKNATIEIRGRYAYGSLLAEQGIHRLIRLSPFNANNLRQTSFASVEVLPVLPDASKEIEVRSEDLKIDTFRASGAGGQHVNKTESAVRITHLPSGIVVSCQSERSQLQNRDQAMKILRSKLLQKKLESEAVARAKLKGEERSVAFGSQIRTYTLHPYTLVKDHRTDTETSDAAGVLEGSLDKFVESGLQWRKRHPGQ